jgi:uncharacterized protein (DUF1330 family)
MAKGYWIAHVTVRDAERYKDYVAGSKIAFENTVPTFWRAVVSMRPPKGLHARAM